MRGQALREFAGLRHDDEPLDPFELARYAKLLVAPFEAIDSLSEKTREHLLGDGKDMWSGGAASIKLPSGEEADHPQSHPRQEPARRNADGGDQPCVPRTQPSPSCGRE